MDIMKYYISLWLWMALLSISPISQAQLTNNGQTIALSGGATMIVKGNLSNSGTLSNNGTLTVEGNWDNSGTYNEQNGTVNLNSNNRQRIQHGGQAFFNLVLRGSGEKVASDQFQIVNALDLSNSLVTTEGEGILIRSSGIINNPSANAYINGLLFHEGTGLKFFPIGKNGLYLPVTLEDVMGTMPIIGLEAFEPNPNTATSDEVEEVSTLRYWQLTQQAGTFDGSLVSLPINGDEDIVNNAEPNTLLIAEADALNAPFRSIGQSDIDLTLGSITSLNPVTGTFITIGIEKVETFFVPNVLSSQAFEADDRVAKVYGDAIAAEDFSFRVYNKWGTLIFESDDLTAMQQEGWRGNDQNSNEELPLGVYTYVMKGRFINGKSFNQTGSITLIR